MAAEVMSPIPPTPVGSPDQLIDTDTKVGGVVINPGFRKHLENYYLKATPEDRARCLELLTSLDISDNLRGNIIPDGRQAARTKRPKTAMAAIDSSRVPNLYQDDYLGPYQTTYGREFSGNQGPSACAQRPGSTNAFQASYALSGPIGKTSYSTEYYKKKQKKTLPIRTGSSSGNRRNNPHPLESFMNWRFPQRFAKEKPGSEWGIELTDEKLDQVCRGKLKSTYQQDYLGIPQGYQLKTAFEDLPQDWKTKVPYTLDTSVRYTYQTPNQQPELKGNTLRYGCNKLKSVPAFGTVPTVSSRQMNVTTRTTYEREYNTHPLSAKHVQVRDLGRSYGSQALEKYVAGARGKDKEMLDRMLQTITVPRPPSGASSTGRVHTPVPPTTCLQSPSPKHLSAWTGPM